MSRVHPARPGVPARRGHRRAIGLAAVTLCAVVLPTATSFGQGRPPADPPGNNGTIKIDGTPFDDHPDNEPHPGCTFQVDFYGFDQGVGDAQVTFALQAPTAKGRTLAVESGDLTPDIGEDPAGGGTDLDASETYRLAFTGAPGPQGYHVKLTVNAPGSIGADTKHKVFWVTGCDAPTPPPTTPTTPTTPPTDEPEDVEEVEDTVLEGTPVDVEDAQADAVPAAAGATPVQGTPTLAG